MSSSPHSIHCLLLKHYDIVPQIHKMECAYQHDTIAMFYERIFRIPLCLHHAQSELLNPYPSRTTLESLRHNNKLPHYSVWKLHTLGLCLPCQFIDCQSTATHFPTDVEFTMLTPDLHMCEKHAHLINEQK